MRVAVNMSGTPAPAYFYPDHVYSCAIRGQAFFLDLKRNEYLSAPLCELRGLSRCVCEWPADLGVDDDSEEGVSTQAALAELEKIRIVSSKCLRSRGSELPPEPPARRVLLEDGPEDYPAIVCVELGPFLKAALVARYLLSVRSLYFLMRRIAHRRARQVSPRVTTDLQEVRRLVEIFKRLQPLLPPTRTPCLVNSVTLLEFLATYGVFPRLVMGVQAHPFSAHCWLQQGDVVLDSTLQHVLQFTPMTNRRSA